MTNDGKKQPSVAIVLLNWNAWADCVECLETLLRQNYPRAGIILCDNGSTDGSVTHLKNWAEGKTSPPPINSPLAELTLPPVTKPIVMEIDPPPRMALNQIQILQNGENRGFAAGNNAGLRQALEAGYDFVWLLNTDTVVDRSALSALVDRVADAPDIGLCGSVLCYYDAPDIVQEVGGCRYYASIALARRIAAEKPIAALSEFGRYEHQLGYVSAASCLVSRAFLEDVGLMSEEYFLYCEEIDWATRARGTYRLGLAADSLVYHKKGRSTGSKSIQEGRSVSSTYYLWRAKARYTKRHAKFGLPGLFACGALFWVLLRLRGQKDAADALQRGLRDIPLRHELPTKL